MFLLPLRTDKQADNLCLQDSSLREREYIEKSFFAIIIVQIRSSWNEIEKIHAPQTLSLILLRETDRSINYKGFHGV
jgi:hypothetical protein